MLRVLPLLLLVIDVVKSPCLHVLHLVLESQGQNPGKVGLLDFIDALNILGFSVLLNF